MTQFSTEMSKLVSGEEAYVAIKNAAKHFLPSEQSFVDLRVDKGFSDRQELLGLFASGAPAEAGWYPDGITNRQLLWLPIGPTGPGKIFAQARTERGWLGLTNLSREAEVNLPSWAGCDTVKVSRSRQGWTLSVYNEQGRPLSRTALRLFETAG